MELKRLQLIAYGPFTDRELDFGEGPGGLHLVYGPNEAGKSSSLRALKALLFGIPTRTTDNFLHSHGELRVGGCLRDERGEELCFVRRKGRKETLLTPDGEPLDERSLAPFLRGITSELFGTLFAIDHDELVRGGEAILAQKGEVGQALFAASLGVPAVHDLLRELEEEADALFRPRASTRVINRALAEYRRQLQEMERVSLSSRTWAEHRRAYESVCRELERLHREIEEKQQTLNRWQRIRRVVPKLARRRELLRRLAEFSDVALLPADFGQRRRQVISQLETARIREERIGIRLEELQARLASLDVDEVVLREEESIDDLHQQVGMYRKARHSLPELRARYEQLRLDAEALLQTVRPDLPLEESDSLRPLLERRHRITLLSQEMRELQQELMQVEQVRHRLTSRLQEVDESLEKAAPVPPLEPLRRVLDEAGNVGDLDASMERLAGEVAAQRSQCLMAQERLGLSGLSVERLMSAPAPLQETIDRFEEATSELAQREKQRDEQEAECREALRRLERELEALRNEGMPPTERQLEEARSHRDRLWRLIRRNWLAGEAVQEELRALDSHRELHELYEHQVAQADGIADRLRREAERVQRLNSLQMQMAEGKQRLERLQEERKALEASRAGLWRDWQGKWSHWPVEPATPREMRAWLRSLESLRQDLERLASLEKELTEAEALRRHHVERLAERSTVTVAAEVSLQTMRERVRERLREYEALQHQRERWEEERESLQRELEEANARQASTRSRMDQWHEQWQEAIAMTGLDAGALPEEVVASLEKVNQLFAKLQEAEKARLQIRQAEEEIAAFSDSVEAIVQQLGHDPAGDGPEQTVAKLVQRLQEARSASALRQRYRQERETLLRERREAVLARESAAAQLRRLMEEARCEAVAEDEQAALEEAEQRSSTHHRLREELERLERELVESEGMEIDALVSEADGEVFDTLPARIHSLQESLREAEQRRTALLEEKIREERTLEQMDGGDEAALLAERLQGLLAGIRTEVEHYTRLVLARQLLQEQIERHRRENQGPLLRRASECFAALTLNSFQGLRAEYFDKDEPELAGVRPSGDLVRVQGMSSGTRDQLYLALRLASLERYIDDSGAMPFIVDDILIHFDEQRTRATLELLCELANKTQVILFTHHRHVVDQAEKLGSGKVNVHELHYRAQEAATGPGSARKQPSE